MLSLKEFIDVTCTPSEAFDYLADFTHIERWDPSVLTARQITEGLPQVGEVIGDKYRLERVLGVGGMGVVVEATHTALDEKVVLIIAQRQPVASDLRAENAR